MKCCLERICIVYQINLLEKVGCEYIICKEREEVVNSDNIRRQIIDLLQQMRENKNIKRISREEVIGFVIIRVGFAGLFTAKYLS